MCCRFRTNKIASPPQTKMTSKDDIGVFKLVFGLVSLKFLRPWILGFLFKEIISLGNTVRGKTTVFGIFSRQKDRGREGDGDVSIISQFYLMDFFSVFFSVRRALHTKAG